MARQATLAEILADDTGRIRPEVADLLMEPPPRPRPRPRPRPQPGNAPLAAPRHLGAGWIVFILIIFVLILTLITPKNRNHDDVSRSESSQSSKDDSAFVNPQKESPLASIVEERTEQERTAESPQTKTPHYEQSNVGSSKIQQERYLAYSGPIQQMAREESFNSRPQPEQGIAERSSPRREYVYPSRPLEENGPDSIKVYVLRSSPNIVVRYYPPPRPEFSQPYGRACERVTLDRYPRTRIVVRGTVPYQINFRPYQRNFYPAPYAWQQVRVPQRIYRPYYSFPPPIRSYQYPFPPPLYRRGAIVYWRR